MKGDDKDAIEAKTQALATPRRSWARRCTPTQQAKNAQGGAAAARPRAPARAAAEPAKERRQRVDAEYKEVKDKKSA